MPVVDETIDAAPPALEMVLCIPGPWPDRDACFKAVMQDSGGYLMLGDSLLHVASSFKCALEFQGPDPEIERAFSASASDWRDTPEMRAIAEHRSVVYLIGQGGTRATAEAMIRASAALLDAGGLGVKVENSGLAHPVEKWRALVANLYLFSAHEALVVYVTGEQIYSCGMHLLGLPDAITAGSDRAAGVELLRVFTRYLFFEAPELRDEQTFAADAEAPLYRLQRDGGVTYPADSLFANPDGYWRLVPMQALADPVRKRWWH